MERVQKKRGNRRIRRLYACWLRRYLLSGILEPSGRGSSLERRIGFWYSLRAKRQAWHGPRTGVFYGAPPLQLFSPQTAHGATLYDRRSRRLLRVSQRTVQGWIRDGMLTAVRYG